MVLTQQVQHSNNCNDFGQLKSRNDCEQEITVTGTCEWIAASGTTPAKCQKKTTVDPVSSFKPYCKLIEKPETNCAKTLDCAYVDLKCTHFTGCQAYVKTTTTDCQAISYFCVSDGNACIQAKECKEYTQQQCESIPSVSGKLKCKWDTNSGACRDYVCSEADTILNTDEKCSACSDNDCKAYQKGCITKGKGCVLATTKQLCSTHSGDIEEFQIHKIITLFVLDIFDQMEFVNVMLVVLSAEQENVKMAHSILMNFVNNTKVLVRQMVKLRFLIVSTEAFCLPKVCNQAPDKTTTDDACNKYQIGCVTTGKGCVTKTNLKSCTTYDGDATSCQSRVGSEGKCTLKTGTKCVAKDCTQATTNLNTNPLCANFFTNCVTTGSGCVSQTSCDLIVKQQSCDGANNCSWQPICTSNSNCSEFMKKSIFLANQARVSTFDKIDENGNPLYIFVSKKCDVTGAYYNTDANCAAELSTCISNRVEACITKYECSQLSGTQSISLSYPGYCTNFINSYQYYSSPCVQRKCSHNTEATDNATCASFLPGCNSNGKGCVDYTTPCKSMKGTQETCNKISIMEMEDVLIQKPTTQLVQVIQVFQHFVNLLLLEVIVLNIVLEHLHQLHLLLELVLTDNRTATKDEDCESFMSGCIAKSDGGCIIDNQDHILNNQELLTSCPNFSGGLQVSSVWTKVACTKYDACQDRFCSDKTSPQSAQDCLDPKSTCRFFKAESACNYAADFISYSLPDTATTDQQKFDYCTSIKDNVGILCGYTSGATKCSANNF
ncbi:unnamed protein product [Paramecium pentaurelia]|uniref:Uncharacterized protein n=1 Tax=Paramecium pentaurelia TaxID=43138 RepID=A0A8S1X992_9CILI|nr:unnamed protein product [Paramecium pentaurelia]